MIDVKSVSKPLAAAAGGALETLAVEAAPARRTRGHVGSATQEASRSVRYLVAKGKSAPLAPSARSTMLETVIGVDDRVRILDTDLAPWRMVCALRMRGANGAGAIGTGWLIGPKTVLTAGHCVFSSQFFGGWASTIEVIPGRNGSDTPFGSVTSQSFTSLDRWVESEDADFDIGCIHLTQDIGTNLGWFALGALPPEQLEGFLVNVSGYPGDRGMGTEQYHHRNRVLRVSERRVFYDVDTFGGQSGAPVWIHETASSPPLAIAIHAYGIGGTPANFGITANSAPRIIPEVLTQIETWVAEDGGWPPV
jgi:V8-like Glu-specific endopeptidase